VKANCMDRCYPLVDGPVDPGGGVDAAVERSTSCTLP